MATSDEFTARMAADLCGKADQVRQRVEVPMPPKRMHLVTVNAKGVARLTLSPRFEVYSSEGDARGSRASHPGADWARRSLDDTALHTLRPAAIEGAIRLLDQPSPDPKRGDIVETADPRSLSAVKRTS